MLIVNGTLCSVVDDTYTNKNSGELVPQTTLVFLPSDGEKETTQVTIDKFQIAQGVASHWSDLVGKKCSVSVRVFSFKNGGYKLIAVDSGLPFKAAA